MTIARATIGLLASGALLTGCGLQASEPRRAPSLERGKATTSPAQPQRAPAPAIDPAGGAATPDAAASEYARAYTNWSAKDLAATTSGTLARLAAGELRASTLARAQRLRSLRGRSASAGTQLAIDVQPLRDRHQRQAWIVLRQTNSDGNDRGADSTRTRVYAVTVQRFPNRRWYVVDFEPQP